MFSNRFHCRLFMLRQVKSQFHFLNLGWLRNVMLVSCSNAQIRKKTGQFKLQNSFVEAIVGRGKIEVKWNETKS